MSRLEQRVVIRHLTLKSLSIAENATELQSVYGKDALKYSTVSKWGCVFRTTRTTYLIWHVPESLLQ
jgi:hypothetical protein